MIMLPQIKDLQSRLGLNYDGYRNGHHVFTKLYDRQWKVSFQYFSEEICEICKQPKLTRKGVTQKAHMKCRNKVNGILKRGKKKNILSANRRIENG